MCTVIFLYLMFLKIKIDIDNYIKTKFIINKWQA